MTCICLEQKSVVEARGRRRRYANTLIERFHPLRIVARENLRESLEPNGPRERAIGGSQALARPFARRDGAIAIVE